MTKKEKAWLFILGVIALGVFLCRKMVATTVLSSYPAPSTGTNLTGVQPPGAPTIDAGAFPVATVAPLPVVGLDAHTDAIAASLGTTPSILSLLPKSLGGTKVGGIVRPFVFSNPFQIPNAI